jgi:putative alpha-1,2-mannosidase
MKAENLSEQNVYIQKVLLNGKPWNKPYFLYDDLKNGGRTGLHHGSNPNKKWGNSVDFEDLTK